MVIKTKYKELIGKSSQARKRRYPKMSFLLESKLRFSSPQNFVDFWNRLYEEVKHYPDKEFLAHLKYHRGQTLEPDDVQWLFEWKNKRWVTSTFSPKPVKDNLDHLNGFRFRDPSII